MIVSDERVAKFVSERASCFIYPPWTAMGIERDGEIVAGVVFNCFTGANVEVTAAGKGWTRGFLRSVHDYVFNRMGCVRLTFTTEQQDVVDLALRFGGQVEGRLRSFYGEGRDATVVGVLRHEYRFPSVRDEKDTRH